MKKERIEKMSQTLGFKVNPNMIVESLYLKYKFGIELDPELDYTDDNDALIMSSDKDKAEKYWDERFPKEMKELFKEEVTSLDVIFALSELTNERLKVLTKLSPDVYLQLIQDVDDELIKDKKDLDFYLYHALDLINGGYLQITNLNHFLDEWDYGFVVVDNNKLIMKKDQLNNDIESCWEDENFDILHEDICRLLLDATPEQIIMALNMPFEIYEGDLEDYLIIELDKYIFGDWYIE